MITIAITNQKGGVGKTSTAHAIGSLLAKEKYKVLFVDIDPQGNLSKTLDAEMSEKTVLDIMQNNKLVSSSVQKISDFLFVIPSSKNLAAADIHFNTVGKEKLLAKALANIQENFDFCIIDTGPALGTLTVNALSASDGVIVPIVTDGYSLDGLLAFKNTFDAVVEHVNPKLNLLGILLTMYESNTGIAKEVLTVAEELAKQMNTTVFSSRIRKSVKIKEAQIRKQSIFDYDSKSAPAKDYQLLVEDILNTLNIKERG